MLEQNMGKRATIKTLIVMTLMQAWAYADWTVCEEISDVYESEKKLCYKRYINSEFGDGGFCVECLPELPETNPWAEVAKVAIPAVAMFGAAYYGAKFQSESQQAWANAYENGISSCYGAIDSFQAYTTESGANTILPKEQASMMSTCNGSSYSSYAGGLGLVGGLYGGVSGSGYINNGFSSGFLGGMVGPNYGYTGSMGMGMYGNGMYGNGMYGSANISLNPWASLAGGALAGLLTGGNLYGGVSINGGIGAGGYGSPYGYGGYGMPGYGMGGSIGIGGNMGYPYGYGYGNGYGNGINIGGSIGLPSIGIGGSIGGNMGGNMGYPYGYGVNTGVTGGLNTGGSCMCITAPCACGNTFPGGNGNIYGNSVYQYPYGGTFNSGNGAWGLGNYGSTGTGAWGQSGGWQAQAQAQAYVQQLNQAQSYASQSRLQANAYGNAYANQALYNNLQSAQYDLYSSMYGTQYNSGYNTYGLGSMTASGNISLSGGVTFP